VALHFLEPAGEVFVLCQCGEDFPLTFGPAGPGLLWQLLSLRLSPDLLPSIRVAALPKLIQGPIVANQLTAECVNNFETPVAGSLVSNAALPRVRAAWVLEG
jgi:hypothetical protein